jgi:hypothetical protein
MSLLSTRLAFTYACTIQRNAAAGDDAWGQTGTPDWQDHLTDEPCRFWSEAGREVIQATGTAEPVTDLRLVLSADADVTEADRIASITYRGGTAQDGPLGIRALLRRPDHLELVLEKV